jgi:hypothetical protein
MAHLRESRCVASSGFVTNVQGFGALVWCGWPQTKAQCQRWAFYEVINARRRRDREHEDRR